MFGNFAQAAVNAAATGDLILVREGSYGSCVFDKGLAIVADAGAARDVIEGTK